MEAQIIDIDQWRQPVQLVTPTGAGNDFPSWQAFPSMVVDPFFLALPALWRSCVVAYVGWWLAPMGVVIQPIETSPRDGRKNA